MESDHRNVAVELYERDFSQWARRNAELLRSGRASEADLDNIAEEIGAIANRARRGLHRRLVRLIEDLLKWEYRPARRAGIWRRSILGQRNSLRSLLRKSPSLQIGLPEMVPEAYDDAATLAAIVLRRPKGNLPVDCPYTAEQLLDEEFLPEPGSDRRAL